MMERSVMRRVYEASRGQQIVLGVLVAFFLVGSLRLARWRWSLRTPPCTMLLAQTNSKLAAEVCHASYERTHDDADRAAEAWAWINLRQKLEIAKSLCLKLRVGPAISDAYACLGAIAMSDSAPEMPVYAVIATVLDSRSGNRARLYRDLIEISTVERHAGRLESALEAARRATDLGKGDSHREYRALSAQGDIYLLENEIARAVEMFQSALEVAKLPCDRATANSSLALAVLQDNENGSVLVYADDAAKYNLDCGSEKLRAMILTVQAWALRSSKPDEARSRLKELLSMEAEAEAEPSDYLLGAYIESDAKSYGDAEHYLELAAKARTDDINWPWEIWNARGELAEVKGQDEIAEQDYRKAMDMVAGLRAASPHEAGYVIASYRTSYERLIALLFRQHRLRDVLAIVIKLDESDMLRSMANVSVRPFHGAAAQPEGVSSHQSAPSVSPWSVDEVLAAWSERDLVIAFAPPTHEIGKPNEEHAYVLRIDHGRLSDRAVGLSKNAIQWAAKLIDSPYDQAAARGLGAMLVPRDEGYTTLDVMGIGALSMVRLAALQDEDGSLVIRRRPLARVQSLGARDVEPATTGASVVLGDPDSNLPSANDEAIDVARGVGTQAVYLGQTATYTHLLEARHAGVLHIAAHTQVVGRTHMLSLAERKVAPADILRDRIAPHLAVLATCSSAAMVDDEGWGSLGFAFIQAGTANVIGTDHAVSDKVSSALMSEFYKQPWPKTDPARALAAVQLHASGSTDQTVQRDWAAFFVLSRPPVIRPTK